MLRSTLFALLILAACQDAPPPPGTNNPTPQPPASTTLSAPSGVSIEPAAPTSRDALTAVVDWTGDPEARFEFTWTRNGGIVPVDGTTIPANLTFRDDIWRVSVIAFTLDARSEPVDADVVVLNSAPDAPMVQVQPANPSFDEDLRCVTNEPSDPDGDTVSVHITWRVDGRTPTVTPTTTVHEGDTIPASATRGGEQWTCTARATDGHAQSFPVTATPREISFPIQAVRVTGGPFEVTGGESAFLTYDFYASASLLTAADLVQFGAEVPAAAGEASLAAGGLSFHDAAHAANQVSIAEGLQACYTCTKPDEDWACTVPAEPVLCEGYRLPTEAEWVYLATEAGFHTDDLPAGGLVEEPGDPDEDAPVTGSSVGSTAGDQCAYAAVSSGPEAPGGRAPNSLGVYDLCGNLEEWTSDAWGSAQASGTDPFRNDATAASRVVRGSSYASSWSELSIWERRPETTSSREPTVGARLVRTVPTP